MVDGFTKGFPLYYEGDQDRQVRTPNLSLRCGSKLDLRNKMIREVQLRRFAGPFTEIPLESYVQSPVGLVPKADGTTCLIFHLSYGKSSINANTPREKCVTYKNLDQAFRLCQEAGQGCFMAKFDMKSTFRNLPIAPEDRKWLVMKVERPISGIAYFFVEKCVAFGSSVSCSHFQRVSSAIEFVFRFRTKAKANN